MTETERQIRAAVAELFVNWVGATPESFERFMASIADSFTGIGTAPQEYWRSRAELRSGTAHERSMMPFPVKLDIGWLEVRMLRPDLALLEGELHMEIITPEERFLETPRFSFILELAPEHPDEQRWQLLHFHFSVADSMLQDEGQTFGDLIDARTQELEQQVVARTEALREQAEVLRTLNETNAVLAAELDLETLVQRLVDAGRDVIGASMGAFFYNVEMTPEGAHADYALSGIARERFEHYPLPRLTDIFRPTFMGESMLRSDDMLADPRYGGNNGTHGGMPDDHPPVRSFLSSPVKERSGEVIGGLLFGHPEPNRFTAEHEALIAGVANQAAIAITNAKLYEAAQNEIEERRRAEAALAKARDRAEEANRAKSTFLAKMSHELRTPLNGILGYTQLLQRSADVSHEHLDGLDVIESSGRHLLMLINDVLDLSKIEAGKLDISPAPFNVRQMLQTTTTLTKVQAAKKNLSFTVEIGDDLPEVMQGDERRLKQIVLNLLSNAVKFTREGHIQLRARAVSTSSNHSRLCVDVEDTGTGIPSDQLESIFAAFEQVRNDSVHSEGTGLGLAISRRLAEMMGGTLHVASTLGKGSRFTLDVPLPVVEEHPSTKTRAAKPVITGVQGTPTLLVVDDKAINRSVVKGMVEPLGFTLLEAANGLEALDMAKEHAVDGILMDLVMPHLDGFETTRQLRQQPALADVPIIALSASVFDVTQQESLRIGCDAFLAKPVDFDNLLETLGRLLHLDWRYADEEGNEPPPSSPIAASSAQTPTPTEAETLYEFALRGDISGLVGFLDTALHLGEHDGFGGELRNLAKQFRMQDIRVAIEPYRSASDT
ncbi:MAG: hypothetical protein RhofKO_34960 [Rhodothermales bacterium]